MRVISHQSENFVFNVLNSSFPYLRSFTWEERNSFDSVTNVSKEIKVFGYTGVDTAVVMISISPCRRIGKAEETKLFEFKILESNPPLVPVNTMIVAMPSYLVVDEEAAYEFVKNVVESSHVQFDKDFIGWLVPGEAVCV